MLRLLAKTSRLRLLMVMMWPMLDMMLIMMLIMRLNMMMVMVVRMVFMVLILVVLGMVRGGLKIRARIMLVLRLRKMMSGLVAVLGLVFDTQRC